jgi:signal transduction histidine kinase
VRLRDLSLGTKLALSLLAFLLVLGVATSLIILYGSNRTQSNARDTSRSGLEDFGSRVLGSFARLTAESTTLEFARAADSAATGANHMVEFRRGGVPTWDASRLVPGNGGIRFDPNPDRLADAWVPSFLADDASVDTRLRDASALDPLFPGLLKNVPNAVGVYFIGTGGEGRYYPPIGVQDIVPPDFDLWTVPGFAEVRPDRNPERNVVWTEPYEDSAGQGLIASAVAPVYFGDEFVGVVGIDISLNAFIAEIDGVQPSDNGFAFFVNRSGGLLGTARADDIERARDEQSGLSDAFDGMRAGEAGTIRISINGMDVFVAYAPVGGMSGSLALVAPADDIRKEANAAGITESIADNGNRTLVITLVVVGGLFAMALVGSTWLNRRVVLRPIHELLSGTREVARGNLDATVDIRGTDEFGELAASFNTMVDQLRASGRQLEQRVDDRTRELAGLLEVARVVSSTLQLEPLLRLVLEQTARVLPCDRSVIMLREGDELQILAVRAGAGDLDETLTRQVGMRLPLSRTPVLWSALREGAPVIIGDVHGPDRMAVAYRDEVGAFTGRAVTQFHSWMGIPLLVKNEVAGVMTVAGVEADVYGPSHAELGRAIASQAGIAIENARLFERTQHQASLEERQRLARELHDSVSQALYGIALGTRTARLRLGDDPQNAAEPIDYVASLAQAGLAEMRALIFELRPESLEQEGVVAAIEKQAASIAARYKLNVELDLGEEPDCSLEVKEALYRIAQEALHNVVKHAQAERVQIRMRSANGSIDLKIRDDGRGFDVSGSFPGHVGLQSMPERAGRLGGTVVIDSAPGRGTTVSAILPVT